MRLWVVSFVLVKSSFSVYRRIFFVFVEGSFRVQKKSVLNL